MEPEELFRTFARSPRPKIPLEFKLNQVISVSASTRFYVQALGSWEINPDISSSEIIALSVVTASGALAFPSVEALEDSLIESEFYALHAEVSKTLATISPMIGYCNLTEWSQKLQQGAKHPSNYLIARSLGNCTSYEAIGDKLIVREHPEVFFGVPRWQLVDAQWIAYWAAHKVYSENLFGDTKEKEKAALQAHKKEQLNP